VGVIDSFDATKQRANIVISYQRIIRDSAGKETRKNYQPLINCPVMYLRGGTGRITLPITKGDPCIILFCDRDIDNWLESGVIAGPNSDRLHDMNDALALVGLSFSSNVVSGYIQNGISIKFSTSEISLEDKIKIAVASQTLKDALDSLCTALTSWIDTHGDSPNAGTVSAINSAKAKIDAVLK
jgi:hypothetical protein